MTLFVDSREPAELVTMLEDMEIPVEYKQLQVGDFLWYDNAEELVLVSRKGSDLVSSVYSDHFQDELERCIRTLEDLGGNGKLFALIEGPWAFAGGQLVRYKQTGKTWFRSHYTCAGSPTFLAGLYLSLNMSGIHVLPTMSLKDTAHTLAHTYKKSQEGWPTSITRRRSLPTLLRTTDTRVAKLMALVDHLPEKVAIRLLKEHGSIWDIVCLANEGGGEGCDELLKTKGFGPTLLKHLQEATL